MIVSPSQWLQPAYAVAKGPAVYASLNAGEAPVYICNADCAQDVETLKSLLDEECGCDVDLVVDIGPVIGAHSGPGTIAVFFLGKER